MTINIACNGVIVLRFQNVLFEILHSHFVDVIEEENIKLNKTLLDLIDKMDQHLCGTGAVNVDIEDWLKNKDDLKVFLNLLEGAIAKCKEYGFNDYSIDVLWKFHDELLKYGESLKQ